MEMGLRNPILFLLTVNSIEADNFAAAYGKRPPLPCAKAHEAAWGMVET